MNFEATVFYMNRCKALLVVQWQNFASQSSLQQSSNLQIVNRKSSIKNKVVFLC